MFMHVLLESKECPGKVCVLQYGLCLFTILLFTDLCHKGQRLIYFDDLQCVSTIIILKAFYMFILMKIHNGC